MRLTFLFFLQILNNLEELPFKLYDLDPLSLESILKLLTSLLEFWQINVAVTGLTCQQFFYGTKIKSC